LKTSKFKNLKNPDLDPELQQKIVAFHLTFDHTFFLWNRSYCW